MIRTIAALLLMAFCAGTAWAGSFSLDFNDETAQFSYVQILNREAYGESNAKVRLFYNEEKDTTLGTVGFGIAGTPGNVPGLKTGVQVSVNGSDSDSIEMLAVSFGLQVDYAPPATRGFGFEAGVHYAPNIFTFVDAENYLETGVGVRYTFMPNASLLVNYQNILIDFEEFGDARVDDSVRVGVKLSF